MNITIISNDKRYEYLNEQLNEFEFGLLQHMADMTHSIHSKFCIFHKKSPKILFVYYLQILQKFSNILINIYMG